jgi:hypothetical protein
MGRQSVKSLRQIPNQILNLERLENESEEKQTFLQLSHLSQILPPLKRHLKEQEKK